MRAKISLVLSQIRRLTDGQTERQRDRETDRQTAFSWLDRAACGKNCLQ